MIIWLCLALTEAAFIYCSVFITIKPSEDKSNLVSRIRDRRPTCELKRRLTASQHVLLSPEVIKCSALQSLPAIGSGCCAAQRAKVLLHAKSHGGE